MHLSRTLTGRIASFLAAAAVLPLVPACAATATDGESVGEESSALVCGINTPPGTKCTVGGGGANLPWASYVTTSTTDLTGTVNFLTQRGASATTVTITSASPSSPLPAPVSDAGGTSHNLVVTDLLPLTQYGYVITVGTVTAYSGTLTTLAGPPVVMTAPPMIRVVEQATTAQLPIALTGVDHVVHGTLHVSTGGSSNVAIPDTPVTLGVGEKLTVILPVTLANAVAETDNSSADLGQINLVTTFTYEQSAPTAPTLLRTYPQSLEMGVNFAATNAEYYTSPSCAALNATGFVEMWPTSLDLQFSWNAGSLSENASNAVLFTMYWRGSVLEQGVFVATQQSQVYFQQSPLYVSHYSPLDYTAIQDDQWALDDTITFTCASVPASTVL